MDKSDSGDLFKNFEKFGLYQTLQYILINLPIIMVAMMNVNYIFVAEDIDYRCRVPECEDANSSFEVPPWWPHDVDSKCKRTALDYNKYNEHNQTCSNLVFTSDVQDCRQWIYETNNSVVSELNLACQTWKITLIGSMHNAGMMVSMLLMGWISDKYGRKPSTILCAVGGSIGLVKILVNNYYAYLVIEFLESAIASGLYTVAVVLMIETGGESKTVLSGVFFSGAVYIGEILFAILAMSLQYWKTLILVTYAPAIIFILYVFILKESIRWQMLRGKMSDARNSLKLMAKVNKMNVTSNEIEDMNDEVLRSKFNVEMQKEKENIKDIIKSKQIMVRLAVTCFCFLTASFIYYGLAIHSVLLPGNKYTNFVLTSILSLPGDLLTLYAFNKYGRRISLKAGYIVCAVFLIAQTYTPDSLPWLKILLFLLGKVGIALCFTGIYTYSVELFPTSVRGSLVGCGNTAARVGSMISPLTPLLTPILPALPSILFASTAVISAALLTFTPETRSLPMFDTIAQVEAYKKKNTPL